MFLRGRTFGKTAAKLETEALSHHEIASHSYGHTLHPTINEYTDIEDFETAHALVMSKEQEAVDILRDTFSRDKIYAACPPGNQKSYVAMYAYSDMGIPVYADTFCDTDDGRGVFYCNIYNVIYNYCMEDTFFEANENDLEKLLDELAKNNRVVLYTHPNYSLFSEWWDVLNYDKVNMCEFGKWKECKRRPKEESDRFYKNLRTIAKLLKNDKRFRITTYSELANEISKEGERNITLSDIPALHKEITYNFYPVTNPVSYSLSDMFLACKEFLLGKTEHICAKVYGFLETPYAISEEITLTKAELIKSAEEIENDTFLPNEIMVGDKKIGPGDWLRAAMEILEGKETVTLTPGPQMPDLDVLPQVKNCSLLGWRQSDEFKDKFLSKRLKLQAWTMRFLPENY